MSSRIDTNLETILDTQLIEVLGRQLLIEQLLRAGIEVAEPLRDRGVDLIAYVERSADGREFAAFPIQMKAASTRAWNLDRKYAEVSGLLLAYVWHIAESEKSIVYALTYAEALAIAVEMGYANSSSWRDGGYYASSNPSKKLVELLECHRMTSERWMALLRRDSHRT